MAKIEGLIEYCNECKFCKVFQQVGNQGGPYAAICINSDIVVKTSPQGDPMLTKIEIPKNCELPDYTFPGI